MFQELIAEEGLEILLDINTKGNPTPEISWQKDDQIVTLDDRYIVTYILTFIFLQLQKPNL